MAYPRKKAQREALQRKLYPSMAELRFMDIMGARMLVIRGAVIAVWSPWFFRKHCQRELKVRGYFIDFAFPKYRRGIEIDGRNYHDIVADYQRDERLHKAGWSVKRIPARRLWSDPQRVIKEVKEFIG